MGEFGARALRDVQESVLAEQAKALQAGYGQAADIFATDVGRLGTLAGVAGQLGGAQQRALLEAAQTTGQLTTSDIENLRRISEQQAGLGESAQALGLRGATALTGIGEAERDLAQRALDLAYQQYQEETRYPYEQIGFQAGIIGGVPGTAIPRTETTTTTARGSEASTLSKILGGLAGAAGIYRTLKG
jgi:hypothetical protein